MSCGCNSSPCNCQPRPSVCCTPTTESTFYTFENANLVGVGVFDNETDYLVQMRGIVSLSASLTVALNATTNAIELDFDDEALVADIPNATTTQRGILETATNAEALAKAATDKILTPSNLAALGSTTTFAGLVELATDAETIAGVSTTLAVTPAGLFAAGQLTGMTTFADAATRAGATPTFDGQLGVQLDTNSAWLANGTTAGDFDVQIATSNAAWGPASIPVLWTIQSDLTIDGDGTNGTLVFSSFGSITFDSNTDVDVIGGAFTFDSGVTLDYASAIIQIGGVSVPANSVFITGAGAGDPSSRLLNTFLSTANVQTGWAVTNPAVTRTLDVAAADLATTRAVLGTLINDLKAILLPAT